MPFALLNLGLRSRSCVRHHDLLFGSLLGSVGGYAYLKIARKDPATYYLPFATFLGAAGLIVVAAHGGITGWYQTLLR